MRKLAAALVIALAAVALHWVAMGLWHDGHASPFHTGTVLTCPMGYVCPVSPQAMREALTAPSPETVKDLAPLLVAVAGVLAAAAIERVRYRPPDAIATATSPQGLRSTFKRE